MVSACSPEPVLRLHSDHSEKERAIVYQGMEYLMSEEEHSMVMPGESAAGEIIIPVTKNAGMLEVIIHIAGETHTFHYRQKAYDP